MESGLIFSPQAEFRRKQIRDYREAGKELPAFAKDSTRLYNYAEQINRNMNNANARRHTDSRFDY